MTDDMMTFRALVEKTECLMEMEVSSLTGAARSTRVQIP